MPRRTQFVDTLKQALWQERMNPRQLALSIGVSPSLLTRILAGERNPPSDVLIAKIAEVLNLDPDKLLMEAGRPPRFLTGFLSATRPISDEDVKVLKQATDRLRQRHQQSPPRGQAVMSRRPPKEMCLYLEQRAEEIAQYCGQHRLTLYDYAHERGVEIELADLKDNVRGRSDKVNGTWHILINQQLPPLGQEWTLGHELGHILLKLKNESWTDDFATDLYFAMALAAYEHHPDNPHIDPVRDWWGPEKEPTGTEALEIVLMWEKYPRVRKRFEQGLRIIKITKEDRERHGLA